MNIPEKGLNLLVAIGVGLGGCTAQPKEPVLYPTRTISSESFGPEDPEHTTVSVEKLKKENQEAIISEGLLRAAAVKFAHSFNEATGMVELAGGGALIRINGVLGFATIGHIARDMETHDSPSAEITGVTGGNLDPEKIEYESVPSDIYDNFAFYPLSRGAIAALEGPIQNYEVKTLIPSDRSPETGEVVAIVNEAGTGVDLHVVVKKDPLSNSFSVVPQDPSNLICEGDSGKPLLVTQLSEDGKTRIVTNEAIGFVIGADETTIVNGCGLKVLVRPTIPLDN